jgi:hypothetical protein
MSSIIRDGWTFHGISVFGRGVFTDDKDGGWTYAGQYRDGYACGLGVSTKSDGSKIFAEYGPDGECDGRWLVRYADGSTGHRIYERGKLKAGAFVYANGRCWYNEHHGEACAPDDPRFLALIAQVAPFEVRPQPQSPTRPSSPLLGLHP